MPRKEKRLSNYSLGKAFFQPYKGDLWTLFELLLSCLERGTPWFSFSLTYANLGPASLAFSYQGRWSFYSFVYIRKLPICRNRTSISPKFDAVTKSILRQIMTFMAKLNVWMEEPEAERKSIQEALKPNQTGRQYRAYSRSEINYRLPSLAGIRISGYGDMRKVINRNQGKSPHRDEFTPTATLLCCFALLQGRRI